MAARDGEAMLSAGRTGPERRWAFALIAAFGLIVGMAALAWGFWAWITAGEPRGIDPDPLGELAVGLSVVRAPAERCPNGSPPVEPCWAEALLTAGSPERTVRLVADNALRAGFRSVDRTTPGVALDLRRDDLCVRVYDGPDPFGTDGAIEHPDGTSLLYLSYC